MFLLSSESGLPSIQYTKPNLRFNEMNTQSSAGGVFIVKTLKLFKSHIWRNLITQIVPDSFLGELKDILVYKMIEIGNIFLL